MSAVTRALDKLPDWPAALTRDEALAYSRFAPTLLDKIVRFKAVGPRGALVCSTEKLREAVSRILDGADTNDLDDELSGVGRG